ncbi:MAG: hypothetical protein ACM3ST_17065 [Bdellovibrio bacteriovorus]
MGPSPRGTRAASIVVTPPPICEEGDRLFNLVNPQRLWLEARVAESDLVQICQPGGVWFRAQGFPSVFEVSLTTGARLVAIGALVEPESRTVPPILEFPRPDPRLRIGQSVTAASSPARSRRP